MEDKDKPAASATKRPWNFESTAVRIGLGIIAVMVVVLIFRGLTDDDSSESTGGAEIATVDTLRERAEELGRPVYWAGPLEGAELELSEPEPGQTFVRYLTDGATAGDPQTNFLAVGTYDFADAAGALETLAEQPGAVRRSVPGGGVAYYPRDKPTGVYLAFPGSDVQIEVYSPNAKQALDLVVSGQIVPIS